MINLVPKDGIAIVRGWYKARLIVVCLILIFTIILSSCVLLLPSIFVLYARQEAALDNLSIARARPVSKEADNLEDLARESNAKIKLLSGEATSSPMFTVVVEHVLSYKTSALNIRYIGRTLDRVTIHGIAKTRTSLLSFIKALEDDSMFGEIVSPISNLISNTDIDFSVDFKIL